AVVRAACKEMEAAVVRAGARGSRIGGLVVIEENLRGAADDGPIRDVLIGVGADDDLGAGVLDEVVGGALGRRAVPGERDGSAGLSRNLRRDGERVNRIGD